MSERIDISLDVNGRRHELRIDPRRTLLEVLRDELRLTGTKLGCGEGACGACLVLVDGTPMHACLSLAAAMTGRAITTVEGLASGHELHPVQQAIVGSGAIQCGFCTPGMVIAAKALLDHNPHPSIDEIREAMSGNVCRCSGYVQLVDAIRSLSEEETA